MLSLSVQNRVFLMQNYTLAFIGGGNMTNSLIGGLITDGFPASKIWVSEPSADKRDELNKKFNVHATQSNQEATQHGDVLIFAVKPQLLKTVATELTTIVHEKQPLVISIAAGVCEPDLRSWLGNQVAVVRCMPNTPALIQSGATALYANPNVSEEQKNLAESILRSVGLTVWIADEEQLDVVTGLSGSGPAYFFLVMEILEQAAVKLGLPKDTARLLTLQTALGAARMALESSESIEQLRQRVTSPGGTTESALNVLVERDIRTIFGDALNAAALRAKTLGKMFGQ